MDDTKSSGGDGPSVVAVGENRHRNHAVAAAAPETIIGGTTDAGPPSLPGALYAQNVASAIIDARTTGSWMNSAIAGGKKGIGIGTTGPVIGGTAGAAADKAIDDESVDRDNVQVIKFSDSVSSEFYRKAKVGGSIHDGYDTDVISDYIGHYGRWQCFWTSLLMLFQVPSTFEIFVFVFQGAPQNFWCSPPADTPMDLDTWRNLTAPCVPINYTALSAMAPDLDGYRCDTFQFEGVASVVSEWNLVCDRFHLVSVTEMSFLVGTALGSVCSGWVSDKYGRRHTLMVLAGLQAFFGMLVSFATSLPMFMALRLVIGFASIGVVMVSFVLLVELVSGKWRTVIGILALVPVSLAYIMMAGIAYVSPDWRTTQLVISVPWFAMLLMWWRLPESPRWLLVNGRIEELCRVVEVAAEWNRIKLPSNYEKSLQKPDEEVKVSFAELFKGPYLRTSILIMVVWYSLILLYFGITLHLNNLGGDMYLNTVIAGLLEAISILLSIWVVLKLGLKLNLVILVFVSAIGCLLVNLIPSGNSAGVIALAMIVKCAIGSVNALIPTYTALQYPTSMRTLSGGIGNFAAGIALITVPYLWLLEHVERNLPMTVMGVCGLLGTVALVLMKNKSLTAADTESDTDSLKTHHTCCGTHCAGGGAKRNDAFSE